MEKITSNNSERVFALDALRAIMMLLGIVLHSAVTYGSIDYKTAWPLKDPTNNLIFDLIAGFIHAFRMPVFFVAAGYFGALLFYRKGPKEMLVNRANRILLPFLAGVLMIYPLVIFAFTFSHSVFTGANAPFNSALEIILSGKFLPFNVAHLWFLYFLMMYAIISCLIAMALRKTTGFTTSANSLLTFILKSFWLRLLSVTLLFFLCLYWMGTPAILTNVDWKIDPAIFVTYFIFFGTGWIIFTTNTLNKIKGYSILQLVIATSLFLMLIVIRWPVANWVLPVQMLFAAVYSSLYIFGFISFFLRYFNQFSRRMSYLMEASYWVYIIHLPIVALMPGLVTDLSLSSPAKFFVTFSSTSIICLASYKYLVRGRFIGRFLNGKVNKQNTIYHQKESILKL